jgi:hypothetical protein
MDPHVLVNFALAVEIYHFTGGYSLVQSHMPKYSHHGLEALGSLMVRFNNGCDNRVSSCSEVNIMFTPARDFLLETPWRNIIPNPNVNSHSL